MSATSFFGGQFFGGEFFNVAVVVSTAAQPDGRGNWNLDKKRKRRAKTMRYSDFDSREAMENALKAAIEPKTIIIDPTPPLGENDDDAILLAVVSKLIH